MSEFKLTEKMKEEIKELIREMINDCEECCWKENCSKEGS